MNEIYIYAISSVVIVSLISLIGILIASIKTRVLNKILFIFVSVSVGALLGDALIHLIPKLFEETKNTTSASLFILLGIVFFFILEKFLRWKHTHDVEDDCHDSVHLQVKEMPKTKDNIEHIGYLLIVSDSVHNLIDGIIIGASYLISIEIGIATTIAIILHEIPQEISEFGVLIQSGFSKIKAVYVNFLSATTAIIGTLLALFIGPRIDNFIPIFIGFAAGSFIYIAGSDLIPEIHKTSDIKRSLIQLISILIGIGIMFLLLLIE
jgi:zinc and cadmium transporter